MSRPCSILRGLRGVAVTLMLSATLVSGAAAGTTAADPPIADDLAPRVLEVRTDTLNRRAWAAAVCSFAQTLAKFHFGSDAEATQICRFVESLDFS